MKCEILEVETGSANSMEFMAVCNQSPSGRISAFKTKVTGKTAYTVRDIYVDTTRRRQRIGTRLYEAVAKEACRRRSRLASTGRLTEAKSHDFWEKQVRKGRARKVNRRGQQPAYLLDCPVTSLDGARRR